MRDEQQRAADRLAEERLELMPRTVRDKLDRVRIKLHLKDWQALPLAQRLRLRDAPCATAEEALGYAALATEIITQLTGKPPEPLR